MIASKQTAYLMARALPSCFILVIINILLIFILPANQAAMDAYHFSSFEYRIITFALSIPSFLVWMAAFISYAKLSDYASSIQGTPEGKYFNKLAKGGLWLAWSLPLSKIFSTILSSITNEWPGFHDASIIISNYFSLILPLVAFVLIGSAARGLVNQHKLKLGSAATSGIVTTFIIAGVSYCYFVFSHFDIDSLTDTRNGYYLPVWLMLVSIMIPYLFMWFIGLLAAFDFALLGTKIKGHLYKRALGYLVTGLFIVLVGSIAIQYTSNVQPRVGYLHLDARLALTFVFRIVQGLGFGLIAVGAVKLKKIEEV